MTGKAYQKAVDLLARREHSAHELGNKLAAKGYGEAEIDQAIALLREQSLQSDGRFIQVLVAHRANAGYGPRYIEAELRGHGFKREDYGEAFAAQDWAAQAKALINKRKNSRLHDASQRRALVQYLLRRGYSSDLVGSLLSTDEEAGN